MRTTFAAKRLPNEWVFLRNPHTENYSFCDGHLRLKASTIDLLSWSDSPTFVARRQEDINFTSDVAIQLCEAKEKDYAGLAVYMYESSHYDIFVRQENNNRQTVNLVYRLGSLEHTAATVELPSSAKTVVLRVEGDKDMYHFAYSLDGETFTPLGQVDTRYISTETAGGFTGIMLGLYACKNQSSSDTYADVMYFDYKPKTNN